MLKEFPSARTPTSILIFWRHFYPINGYVHLCQQQLICSASSLGVLNHLLWWGISSVREPIQVKNKLFFRLLLCSLEAWISSPRHTASTLPNVTGGLC